MLNSLGLRMKQLCLLFELPITKVELIQDNKGVDPIVPPTGVKQLCLTFELPITKVELF